MTVTWILWFFFLILFARHFHFNLWGINFNFRLLVRPFIDVEFQFHSRKSSMNDLIKTAGKSHIYDYINY